MEMEGVDEDCGDEGWHFMMATEKNLFKRVVVARAYRYKEYY